MTNASLTVAKPPPWNVPPSQNRLPMSRSPGPSMKPLTKCSASIRGAPMALAARLPPSTTASARPGLSLAMRAPSSKTNALPEKRRLLSPSGEVMSNRPWPMPPPSSCREPDSTWTTPSLSNGTRIEAALNETSSRAPARFIKVLPAAPSTALEPNRNWPPLMTFAPLASVSRLLPLISSAPVFNRSTANVRRALNRSRVPPAAFVNCPAPATVWLVSATSNTPKLRNAPPLASSTSPSSHNS